MIAAKRAISLMTGLTAWLKRNQIIPVPMEMVKVNLGSGLSVARGWINIDASLNALASNWPGAVLGQVYRFTDVKQWYSPDDYIRILKSNRFVLHRVEYGVPFKDASVDYLFCSHMLEHLYFEDANELVSEIYRVLKPGGRLRLAVPDLEYAVALYQKGEKEKGLSYFFTARAAGPYEQHRYMYDFDLLRRLLVANQFREIERCGFGSGKVPDVDVLDNRPEETLFVEALK